MEKSTRLSDLFQMVLMRRSDPFFKGIVITEAVEHVCGPKKRQSRTFPAAVAQEISPRVAGLKETTSWQHQGAKRRTLDGSNKSTTFFCKFIGTKGHLNGLAELQP